MVSSTFPMSTPACWIIIPSCGYKSNGPAMPMDGSVNVDNRFCNQPIETIVSLFKNTTYSPFDALYPWLQALANPLLVGFETISMSENSCWYFLRISSVASFEPLSTTITSYKSVGGVFAKILERHCAVSSTLLKTGITIEIFFLQRKVSRSLFAMLLVENGQ